MDNHNELHAMRHSAAHVLASAVQRLWPQAKFGVGPVVEHGFYYDIDLGESSVSEEDFERIEAEMKQINAADQPFVRSEKPIDEAIAWAQETNQPYKLELLNDLKRAGTTLEKDLDPAELGTLTEGDSAVEQVSFYQNGDFVDLCRGPHVASTGKIGAFKLIRVSGAYWRGDEKKPQMQRVYGVAFATQEELDRHLKMLEEAKKRDHRKLGQDLDLFTFSEVVGAGLPLFTPRGTILRDELLGFSEELQKKNGFQKVFIPHITKQVLYEKSGHWDKFGTELFLVKSQETNDQFVLKPMNCPHHIQIYASRPRSYRDLPIRYMESTVQYRDEKKGELNGLSRVRAISIDDAHIFCRLDQIEAEFTTIMNMIKEMYTVFDMKFQARLSFRDESDDYLGDPEVWQRAQDTIETVAKKLGLEYFVAKGEAAFYGPKIDILVTDALGREWQCATEQLDFVQPQRFGLIYVDDQGKEQQPVMIHKALLGSFERFLSVYIEHTAGKFPVWLAPEQIRIITVNQEEATLAFANKVVEQAQELDLRVHLDNDNESVGKKIRNAEVMKVPYTIVVGEKEIISGQVVPRLRSDLQAQNPHESHDIADFLQKVSNEAKSRTRQISF